MTPTNVAPVLQAPTPFFLTSAARKVASPWIGNSPHAPIIPLPERTVTAIEARKMRGLLRGRLINAYSKADKTLLLNVGETCLGRNEVENFESIEMNDFGHTDYWERLAEVLTETRFKAFLPPSPEPVEAPAEAIMPTPMSAHRNMAILPEAQQLVVSNLQELQPWLMKY